MTPKDVLAALGVVAVVAAFVGAGVAVADIDPGGADTTTREPRNDRTIAVSASGKARAEPDKAVIRLEVEATAPDPTVARTWAAENVSKMREALSERGIANESIRTIDFNLYKDEPHGREREERGTVYRVSHELVIEVDDIGRAGSIIDTAVNNGATSIHDVEFTLSATTRQDLRKQALADAMANARDQADVLAESANLRITGVEIVTTGGASVRGRSRSIEMTPAPAAAGGGTDLSSGPVSVVATVSVTYNATDNA